MIVLMNKCTANVAMASKHSTELCMPHQLTILREMEVTWELLVRDRHIERHEQISVLLFF